MRGISNILKRGVSKTVATRCFVAVLYYEVYVTWKCASKGGGSDPVQHPLYICFASGTPVKTPEGRMSIEHLKVGDSVLSVDPGSNSVVSR